MSVVSDYITLLIAATILASAKKVSYNTQQLVIIHFGYYSTGSGIQCGLFVQVYIMAGQNEYAKIWVLRLKPSYHLDTVDAGKGYIHQNDIRGK